MTELGEKIIDVLSGMPVLPAEVGRNVLSQLARIEAEMADDMIEGGTIMVEFRDLADDFVILTMTVAADRAFLSVAATEEDIAISHGYSFDLSDRGLKITVDTNYCRSCVDHSAMLQSWHATRKALARIDEAKALMRTHPIFRDIA